MLDYGEFVPEALKVSQDSNLLALGLKLDLFDALDDAMGADMYAEIMTAVLKGSHALVETNAYLRLVAVLRESHALVETNAYLRLVTLVTF